ncbi:hypothetical protein [Geoglobus acetivorans]|uniref:Uncharacterized protein n=1 Tax=Geoglobus acetivorans TaxID=565033 RepID=A0A0A7GD79_GEOAI|nr:hypothetical protein GACE_0727 [Geoglobus acetivorans]
MKRAVAVLLVLVMVGSVVSPVTAAAPMTTGRLSKDLHVVAEKSLKSTKARPIYHMHSKSNRLWKPVNESYAISKAVAYALNEVDKVTKLDKTKRQMVLKAIEDYLKAQKLDNTILAEVEWNDSKGSESIAIIDLNTGNVVFDSHMWFYAATFVEKSQNSISSLAVHWSDYKNFHRVFDIYNVFGIKIATWTFDTTIITEISPSSSIDLSGTGYVDSSVYFDIQTEGITLNQPAILFGDGATSGTVFHIGDDVTPNTGAVDVDYKINYVALAGVEFHTIELSDSYTAHLEFSRG